VFNVEFMIALLCVTSATYLIVKNNQKENFITELREKKHFGSILSIFLMFTLSISIYQVYVIYCFISILFIFILHLIIDTDINIKRYIQLLFINIFILICSICSYFFINFVLIKVFGSLGYVESFFRWNKESPKKIIFDLYSYYFKNLRTFSIIAILFILFIAVIFLTLHFNRKKNKIIILTLLIIFSLSPLYLNILTGSAMPYRTYVIIPLVAS
jgi:hypothetical protein